MKLKIMPLILLSLGASLSAMERRHPQQRQQAQRPRIESHPEQRVIPLQRLEQKNNSPFATEKKYEQESTDYKKWLVYANQDAKAAEALMSPPNEFPNQAVTLSVQSGEKSLKAFLTYKKIKLTRTHDLQQLFEACKTFDNNFENLKIFIDRLGSQPPGLRYPSRNIPIHQNGISDYKRKVITMIIESAQNIYKFVEEKIDLNKQESLTTPKIRPSEHQLLEAVTQNDTERAEQLLQDGADVNARSNSGNSALFIAVDQSIRAHPTNWVDKQKNRALVKLLLRNHADVNIQNNDGETALFCAAGVARAHLGSFSRPPTGYSSLKLVKLLLRDGAEISIKNRSEQTIFDVVQMPHIKQKNRKIFEFIENYKS